ncbi:hypothetical protein AAEX63_00380 [Luteococcus sp. H138]|uniref:hypothetical protein n=1 Tax=unclassified Luteococcus TaxID=2639923 RepID=UPI00313BFA84
MTTPQYPQDPMQQKPQGQPGPGQPYVDPSAPAGQQSWGQPQTQPWGQIPPQGPVGNLPANFQQPGGLVPTTPPPVKSKTKMVFGWILLVFTVLGILSLLSRAGQGKLVLVYPDDLGRTIGSWIGMAIFNVLPAWGAYQLLTSHSRAMQKWHRGQGLPGGWAGQELPPYQ